MDFPKRDQKVAFEPVPMYRNSIGRLGTIPTDCPAKVKLLWCKHDGLNKATHTANKGSAIITDDKHIIIGAGFCWKHPLVKRNLARKEWYSSYLFYSDTEGIHGTPCISDGRVFIGTYEGGFYCFNEMDGALLWRTKLGSIVRSSIGSSPVVFKDSVYIVVESRKNGGEHTGNLFILDCQTGKIKFETDIMKKHSHSSVALDPLLDCMIVGDNNNDVHCWTMSPPHDLRWKISTGGCVKGPLTIHNGVVFLGSWDFKVYALNVLTGEIKWTFDCGNKVMSGISVDLDYQCIYFGSHDRHLYCLHEETGKLIWKFKTGHSIASCPLVTNNIVLVGSGTCLFAIDKFSGKSVWKYTDKKLGALTSTPVISHLGDQTIVFSSRGRPNPNKLRSGLPEFLAAGVWALGPK